MSLERMSVMDLPDSSERREGEPVTLEADIYTVDMDDIDFDSLTVEQEAGLRAEPDFIRRFDVRADNGQQWSYLIGATEFMGGDLATSLDTTAPIEYTESNGPKGRTPWSSTAWDHLAHRGQFNFTATIDTSLLRGEDGTLEPLSLLEPYRLAKDDTLKA